MSTAIQPVDITRPEYIHDPYPIHRAYREHDPFFWSGDDAGNGFWYVTGFEEITALYRDLRFKNGYNGEIAAFLGLPPEVRKQYAHVEDMLGKWLLISDDAKHARLRKLMNVGFTNRHLRKLEAYIETLVDQLLDRMEAVAENGELDYMEHFANRLPSTVITEMLSFPQEDREQIIAWVDQLNPVIGLGFLSPEILAHVSQACIEMSAYFKAHIDDLRRSPRDSVLQSLVDAEIDGERLSEEELISQTSLMYFGGNGTTKDLLGNGLHLLFQHPDQFAKLKANPDLVSSAVEEMLRFEPSIQAMGRTTREAFDFMGRAIQPFQRVLAINAAANRDPKMFPDPEVFDIERSPNKHLAFGIGIHFCLGANLSRLEANIAFRKLLARFPDISMVEQEVAYNPTPIFRGLQRLRVRLG